MLVGKLTKENLYKEEAQPQKKQKNTKITLWFDTSYLHPHIFQHFFLGNQQNNYHSTCHFTKENCKPFHMIFLDKIANFLNSLTQLQFLQG